MRMIRRVVIMEAVPEQSRRCKIFSGEEDGQEQIVGIDEAVNQGDA